MHEIPETQQWNRSNENSMFDKYIYIEDMILNISESNFNQVVRQIENQNSIDQHYIQEFIQYAAKIRPRLVLLLRNLWFTLKYPILNRKTEFMSFLRNSNNNIQYNQQLYSKLSDYYNQNSLAYTISQDDLENLHNFTNEYNPSSNIIKYNQKYYTPIDFSALTGSLKCFNFFLDNNSPITTETLSCSIKGGNLQIIQKILQHFDIKPKLIYDAIKFHQNNIVEWLVSQNIKPKIDINLCILALNTYCYSKFRNNLKNVNMKGKDGWTPLICASRTGNDSIVEDLLNQGSNPLIFDGNNRNAFVYAAKRNNISTFKLLFDHSGSDLNLIEKNYWNPLIAASYKGNDEIAKILLENGFPVDSKDEDGKTSLIWASLMGNLSTVKILLSYNASLDTKDDTGCSAIHYAAKEGYSEICRYLISCRADINHVSSCGWTPLKYALKYQRKEAISNLMQLGSKQPRTFLLRRYM